MAENKILSRLVYSFFKKLFEVKEDKSLKIDTPHKIIVIRQHNQLGDLLTGVSVLRALKENYPASHLTLVASPFNYPGLIKNKFIDKLFVFDKKKLFDPVYLIRFLKLLREPYDLAIVPVTVSISFTSNIIARLSNSKTRIGPKSLNGKGNKSVFLFDRRVEIDWQSHPDSNVAERSLDIIRPFGINTTNYRSEITSDENDKKVADDFISSIKLKLNENLIGFHVGAGKIPNRWSLKKYLSLIEKLKKNFEVKCYLTGSSSDKEEINYFKNNVRVEIGYFIDKKIPEVAALISKSDLFISNDTGIMHVAGTTETPQISIFGPTNPFNWAPIGTNKYFIRKSDLIDDVSVDDVYSLCTTILSKKKKCKK